MGVLLSIGALALYSSYRLGRWRQGSQHRASDGGYDVPRLWRRRSMRVASWIGVSFLAMLAAGCVLVALGPWPGLLPALLLLYARWAASNYAAFRAIARQGVPLAPARAAPLALRLGAEAGAQARELATRQAALRDQAIIRHTSVK